MGGKHSRQQRSDTFFSPYNGEDAENRQAELKAELAEVNSALRMVNAASQDITLSTGYPLAKEKKKIKKELKKYR